MSMKKNKFISMITDESGNISSKRVLGILLVLCITFAFMRSTFQEIYLNEALLEAVTDIAMVLIFATTGDKAFKYISTMRSNRSTKVKQEDEEQEDGSDIKR